MASDWTAWSEQSNSVAVSPRRVFGTERFNGRSPSLVAIGNFDGVHPGHREVLLSATREAQSSGLAPLALTFHPHPAQVLGRAPLPVLTTIERKVELMLAVHPDLVVLVEPFTQELSRWSPETFAQRILVERLLAKVVLVGENFRFGREREGDLETLARIGGRSGFEVRAQSLMTDALGPYSSTRVREALKQGNLSEVERSLGRPHSLSGKVIRGAARGRSIGVPTANLAEVEEALPPHGVYACLVDRADEQGHRIALARGVMNLGLRPTVSGGFSVEVHLLDFEGDLYDQALRVHLIERIRDEQRFSDLGALRQQIQADIREARRMVAGRVPDPGAGGAWA